MRKANDQTFQINGRVIDIKSRRGIAGLRVEAWDKDLLFDDLVGSAVTDTEGRFRIEFSGSYFRELFFDRKPDLFFKVFSGDKLIKSTQDSVLWNVRAGQTPVEIAVPWEDDRMGDDGLYIVAGTVVSPDSAGVGGLRVQVLDRNVGRDVMLAETFTDERGRYRASFEALSVRERNKKLPDLQARAYVGNEFLAASDVRYNATELVTLNIRLPAHSVALPSEYETLTRALSQYYDGRLSDLKETNDRQDITYLANKTGWDARSVALAALADQFSRQSADASGSSAIKPAFYYALFRASLPANPDTLYQADPKMVERIWKQAVEQGVIPKALSQEIGSAVGAFQRLSTQKLLTAPSLAGASSLKEMLAASRLNESQQQKFAELYTAHRTDLPKFWEAVEDAFDVDTARQLQVDGKLGFLTINNAPLVRQLHNAIGDNGVRDPVELAQKGYHRAAQWRQLLNDNVPVPKEIPGETTEAKRRNYEEYLAAQVRLSYPTASVAEMVRSGDLVLDASEQVHTFLTNHQGKFEIGMQPVERYIAQERLDVPTETVAQVKRLQRVYQITPNDEATAGLLRSNIDAASQVVRYERETFVQTFAQEMGGPEIAEQTYDKSLQVHNVVLNIAISYLTARNGIGLGAQPMGTPPAGLIPDGQIIQPAPKGPVADDARDRAAANADDVIAYPTLEELFGEMDFCACDHCRSILSPAAYLVDLLLFINQPPTEAGKSNPQTVLLEKRRPDIQHLPLTCENTNIALPYIDVVNETLEYFVANNVQKLSLKGYVGHDTDGAASEDLLASPQFVMDSAYATLRDERFPAPLPFHQPLETLRRYFDKFEVPLTLAMERLRKSDNLERGTDSYAWRDILLEELRLSRAEHEILTDFAAVPLWEMYGFADGTADDDVIADLSNAKKFTRRVAITYEDIAAVLKTRFVNPNSDLIPKLQRLGVPFAALKALKDGTITGAAFDALLPTEALAPDPAEYDGDGIKAWVKKQENYDRIMKIITLTDPTASDDPCSFDTLEFRYAEPMAAVGDTSTRLGVVEFIRLLRFIRLWKKLGWTIEQTDAAICALFPVPPFPLATNAVDTVAKLDNGFLTLLPRLGIVLRVVRALNLTPNRDLLPLLACWSPLGTHGGALYQQMFLSPAMLAQDATFDDNGYGEFLQDNTQKLLGHAEALRAAFGLTDDEFSQIVVALGFDADFVDVSYNHTQPTLQQPIRDTAPGIGYDDVTKRLSYTGALNIATRNALKALPGVSAAFQAAVDALYAANQAALTTLTLDNISAIYRRGWLARKMKLSVREFLLLTQLTGLDPFAAPDPTNPAILRIIELAQALKSMSLKSAAALYLIWNQDLSGKSAPDPAQVTEFARTLRADFASIEDQFAATEDPGGDIARTRMTLVYGTEAANDFFALLDDTLVLDVPYTHPPRTLSAAIIAAAPRIAYDDFRRRLSHTGILSEAQRDALKAVPGVTAAFQAAVDAIFALSEDAKGSFFARHPELKPFYDDTSALEGTLVRAVDYTHPAPVLEAAITNTDPRIAYDNINHELSYSGILTSWRADILKNVVGVPLPFTAAVDALFALSQEARGEVLATLQPELSRRRKRQQAVQRFSAAASTDLIFTQALLDPPAALGPPAAPYPLHAAEQPARPALDDVLALETPGLAAQFFFRNTATGVVDLSVTAAAKLDYPGDGSNPLPVNPAPGGFISGIWRGQVETPEAGFYNFIIEADAGATVTLSLGGLARPLTQNGNIWRNSDPLPLTAGTLYEIVLTVNKVKNALSVKWETPKRAREVIIARYLYPPPILPPFTAVYIRFLKAASLAQTLRLTANEISRFATDADYQIAGDGWLNALAVSGDPAAPTAAALLKPLRDLLDFARIKSEISPDDESLLTVLQNPTAATTNTDSLLYTITHWDKMALADLLTHFNGNIAGLAHFDRFRRVYHAFVLVQKMGISASALIEAATNEPTGDTMRDLQAALRARYEASDWRTVIQPINDEMRALQRDALVAYILHQMRSQTATEHINTPDKLFEYFLMDVQMEPCMQTSRIRHALSSVQLFIERCLMNLEPSVSPTSIIAKQWEWMKRYRVWEANRKVFIFPENWLEPELRDDKSPFFKEIESELLQSDITEDTATTALLNYLAKLEEVAKLEPCGIFHAPADPVKRTGEVDHVIARTAGAQRKYYYRRYEYGYWTPWEQVKLDIEDNPVTPVIWRGRLMLFWLRLLKQTPVDPNALPTSSPEGAASDLSLASIKNDAKEDAKSNAKVGVQAMLCWSEYYNGKWQAAKISGESHTVNLGKFDTTGASAFDRSRLTLSTVETDEELWIKVYGGKTSGAFLLYNTHSLPETTSAALTFAFGQSRGLNTLDGPLLADYWQWIPPSEFRSFKRQILNNDFNDRTVEPLHQMTDEWNAPFFYEDVRNVFFVTSAEQQVQIYDYPDYGITVDPTFTQFVTIPPLIVEFAIDPHLDDPRFWGDGGPIGPDPFAVNPMATQQFITEDANISRGITTTESVKYGGRMIGPGGSIDISGKISGNS
ncbi:MAG TPA: neuraminidase-like domain-containing protein [Pyrinomonadaceae bacterium]|jgi:hypothetical protein